MDRPDMEADDALDRLDAHLLKRLVAEETPVKSPIRPVAASGKIEGISSLRDIAKALGSWEEVKQLV